jgi:hypothetical protein
MRNKKNIAILSLVAVGAIIVITFIIKMYAGGIFSFLPIKSESVATNLQTKVIDIEADLAKNTKNSAIDKPKKSGSTISLQPPAEDAESLLDKEKHTNARYSINLSLSGARSISDQGRPQANAASWHYFTNKIAFNRKANGVEGTDSFVDPHTGTVYVFTTGVPNYGEIQYRTDTSCNKSSNEFAAPRIHDNFAFRLRFKKTGIECFTNF